MDDNKQYTQEDYMKDYEHGKDTYGMDNQKNYDGPVQYQPTQIPNNNKDGMATAILVLGILSIVCCAPCGVVALVLRAGNKDQISEEKQGLVKAGFITSIIGLCFCGIGLIRFLLYLLF